MENLWKLNIVVYGTRLIKGTLIEIQLSRDRGGAVV